MDAIRVRNLTKRYGDTLAVDDVAFTVPAGATVGLLGGNGAGKTTTIAMLLGLLIPTAGTIEVLGHDMARDRFAALARMNFSSPYVSLPQRLSVAENLRVYGHLYDVPHLAAQSHFPQQNTAQKCRARDRRCVAHARCEEARSEAPNAHLQHRPVGQLQQPRPGPAIQRQVAVDQAPDAARRRAPHAAATARRRSRAMSRNTSSMSSRP